MKKEQIRALIMKRLGDRIQHVDGKYIMSDDTFDDIITLMEK